MKKIFLSLIFILSTLFSFSQEIMPPYNLQVALLSNEVNDSIANDSILLDTIQMSEVEVVLTFSLLDVTTTDSVFIKLVSNNITLLDSFLLPNNLTNSELPCTIFVNSLQVPLGNYSNLSNYTIECYLRDNNGVISSISTFPDY